MATKGDGCVKRDVCTFYGCGSTSDLCADCGHYLAEAVKTPTNTASSQLIAGLISVVQKHGWNSKESLDYYYEHLR